MTLALYQPLMLYTFVTRLTELTKCPCSYYFGATKGDLFYFVSKGDGRCSVLVHTVTVWVNVRGLFIPPCLCDWYTQTVNWRLCVRHIGKGSCSKVFLIEINQTGNKYISNKETWFLMQWNNIFFDNNISLYIIIIYTIKCYTAFTWSSCPLHFS